METEEEHTKKLSKVKKYFSKTQDIIPFINHGHFEIKTLPLITDNSGLFLSFNQNMQL
jgi:hypothetical protein